VLFWLLRSEIEVHLLTALGRLSDAEVLVNDSDENLQHDNYRSLYSTMVVEHARKAGGNTQFVKKTTLR